MFLNKFLIQTAGQWALRLWWSLSRGEQHYYKLCHQINLTGWPVQSVEEDQKHFSVSSWAFCVLMKIFMLCLSEWLWIGGIKIKKTSYDSHASKRTADSTQMCNNSEYLFKQYQRNTEMCRRKKSYFQLWFPLWVFAVQMKKFIWHRDKYNIHILYTTYSQTYRYWHETEKIILFFIIL